MRKYGLPILVLLLLCGQLLRIPVELVPFKTTAVVPNDVGLAVFCVLLLLRKLRLRQLFFHNALLSGPIFLFVLAAAISLGVNADYYNLHGDEIIVSALYFLRWVLYCSVYFAVVDLVRSRKDAKELAAVLTVALVSFAAFGIYQSIYLPDFAFIVHPDDIRWSDWDVQYSRLVSTFLDPNLAACFVGVGLAFSVAFLMEGYRKSWFTIAVFGLALILTYSRGGCLSFIVGLTYIILSGKYKRRGLIAAGAIALIVIASAPYTLPQAEAYRHLTISDPSARIRVQTWLVSKNLIQDNLFFGVGFNTLPYVVPRYGYKAVGASAFGLDGGLLVVFALTGIFGFAAYTYLLAKALWMAHFVCEHSRDRLFRVLAKGSFASTLIIVVSSFFTSSLLYLFIMEFAWMEFGLLNCLYIWTERRNAGLIPRPLVAPSAADSPGRFGGRARLSGTAIPL